MSLLGCVYSFWFIELSIICVNTDFFYFELILRYQPFPQKFSHHIIRFFWNCVLLLSTIYSFNRWTNAYLSSNYCRLDTNLGAGVNNKGQNLSLQRSLPRGERQKYIWVEIILVWIKHVRHWLISSGPSNWTRPWFLTWLKGLRGGQRRSYVGRKSQAIHSQESKRHNSSSHTPFILPVHLLWSSEFQPSKQTGRIVASVLQCPDHDRPQNLSSRSEVEASSAIRGQQTASETQTDLKTLKERP